MNCDNCESLRLATKDYIQELENRIDEYILKEEEKEPDEQTIACWVAGLLEGEGCFSIFTRSSATHNHKSLAIHCEMTDQDVIEKLHRLVGCGTVNKRQNTSGRKDRRERKPTWIWSVQNHEGIKKVCESIYPFMGKRRQQKIKEMLDYVRSKNSMGNT